MSLLAAGIALAILALVAARPDLEIAVARAAMRAGDNLALLGDMRNAARIIPISLLAVCLAGLGLQLFRTQNRRVERARMFGFLLLTFALGPGLLVNGVLKPHSHRPRPAQTAEVAGAGQTYRPFYRFDGGCIRNCSFSSGEAAAAFWTVAPALLAPSALVAPAVGVALAFGTLVGALRVLAGGHFLSDVAFSALLVLVLVAFARRSPAIGLR